MKKLPPALRPFDPGHRVAGYRRRLVVARQVARSPEGRHWREYLRGARRRRRRQKAQ